MSDRNSRWYAVRTRVHAEAQAALRLSAQGFVTFLPEYRKRWRHARRVEIRRAPLFPRYLFVLLDLAADRWRSVNGTIGVERLVAFGDIPVPIPSTVVEDLIGRRDGEGFVPLYAAPKPGDHIRVVDGAFAAALGLFESVADADRVAILLDLLGRKVRVVLDRMSVEAAG